MADPTGEFELFYSYAHKDEKLRSELEKRLFNLKRQGLISAWHDRDISAGTLWADEIDSHLNSAHIILLLISPDFIASEYCYSIEMTRALERHESGEARVIPIILRPCDWKNLPISKLQALPTNSRAVTNWKSRDEAFLDVATGIKETLKKMLPPAQKQNTSPENADIAALHLPVLLEAQELEANRAPAWNLPYRQNPLFTSREDILEQLHEMFTRPAEQSAYQPVVLSGLGGMGKTQIAIEYAYRHREQYHDVLWARADSQEGLTSELANFATLLNLPGQREHDQPYALSSVKHWLEAHADWLLILDNVENLKMVHELLPAEPQGHILLTAQTRIVGDIAQRLDIDKMSPEVGALLLLRRAKLTSNTSIDTVSAGIRTQAIEIAKLLDGLPLAIDQAGAYIEETEISLRGYIELYASRRADLLKARGGIISDHASVTATMSLSFEKVEQSNSDSAELLRLLAFLHPDAIPADLLEHAASQLGSTLQTVASNPLSLNKAMGVLLNYSLVRRNVDNATLTIHRLVQAVIRDGMDEPTQRQWAERTVRAVNHMFPKVEFATWATCQQYLPQAQVCSELIATLHLTFSEAARLLYETGRYLDERAQYQEAIDFILQSLHIREQTLGTEHLAVAESLTELAELYRKQGMFLQGEPLLKRALTIREQTLGPDHPDLAQSLNRMGRLYIERGQYREAEPLLKRALVIHEQVYGPDHPDTAMSLNDLARIYYDQGQYHEAEPFDKRALAIHEQVYGPSHPDTALSLNNLSALYIEQGQYSKAEPPLKRALAINEQVLGPSHPNTAMSLNNLAFLYNEQGQYHEAEPLYKRALAIREQVLGYSHPETALSLNNLATLYYAQRQYHEAELLYKRALAIREQVLGPYHPDTATSLNDLARLYYTQRQYHEAELLYKRALTIYEQAYGPEHSRIVSVLGNYVALLKATNRKARAAEMEARMNILRRNISIKNKRAKRMTQTDIASF